MRAESEFEPDRLPKRVVRALETVDMMPGDLRECVHEFGFAIVHACMEMGIKEPRHIRHLVSEIWRGARQPHQRRSLHASRGDRQPAALKDLDWLLIQSGSTISAATLIRVLWSSHLVIVSMSPSEAAIDASLAELADHNERVTKREKHRRRLLAGFRAQAKKLWPHLFSEGKSP